MAAKIIELIAPAVANGGDIVLIDVSIQNTANQEQLITVSGAVSGVYDSSPVTWQFDYLSALPGETLVFRGNFVMPIYAVSLQIYSWHWDGNKWIQDETRQTNIGAGIQNWYLADETTRGIERTMQVLGWYLADEAQLSVLRAAAIITGWHLVDEQIITVNKQGPKPPVSKFPWGIAIAGVGVAMVVVTSAITKKPTRR